MNDSLNENTNTKNKFTSFRISPLSVLLGTFWLNDWGPISSDFQINLEKSFAQKQSIQLDLAVIGEALFEYDIYSQHDTTYYYHYYGDSVSITKTNYTYYNSLTSGFNIGLSYKFFIKDISQGLNLYAAPHISYAHCKIWEVKEKQNRIHLYKLDQAMIFGVQYTGKKGISLDISTGIGFKEKRAKVNLPSTYVNDFDGNVSNSTAFYMNVSLGIAIYHQ